MIPAPAEIDVFSRPHSRIKRLVDGYSQKLGVTDFSNYTSLKSFLSCLRLTFQAFKTHESIENECIMEKLKNRLDYHKVIIDEVAEVHSDDCLGKMKRLVEDGWMRTDTCNQSRDEMMLIGNQLSAALRKFTENFLPHMKEEEEIFQPLLMKYFTYDELREIQGNVIRQHSMFMTPVGEKADGEVECQDKLVKEEFSPAPIQLLPSELTLKIFSLLGPRDLCQCQQVCSQWSTLARDSSLWKSIHPVRWAQGDWRFNILEAEPEMEGDELDDAPAYTIDEDADIDESESSEESDSSNGPYSSCRLHQFHRETRVLMGLVKYLLPVIGSGVEVINLASGKTVTSALVYKMLQHTPNIRHINLSSTKISDAAFKRLSHHHSCSKLDYLDLSGCENITDLTLQRLAETFKRRSHNFEKNTACTKPKLDKNGKRKSDLVSVDRNRSETHGRSAMCPNCGRIRQNTAIVEVEDCAFEGDEGDEKDMVERERTLKYLSLSGCYKITDDGLRALLNAGPYPYLQHLDLSGCLNVTAQGLSDLVKVCESLNHQEFFYCDNIVEGPYAQTASGCQNLECGKRACCRTGE